MQQLLTNLKTRQSLHTYLGLEKTPQKCQEYDKLNSSFLSIQIAKKKNH